MHISLKSISCISKQLAIAVLLLFVACMGAHAQSTNIEFPTPVVANEVSGVIEARDIGDARLTRHFYLLTGTQGDLILTVESSNLNGDIDLFTAGSLRPLTKLSMYAGLSTSSATKSVFLRDRESLILRVEARSSNDEAGRYHIRFSGGFEPIANATPPPENVEPTVSSSTSRDKNVRRVNSAGARIKEEETEEVAKVEPPKPAPAPKVKERKTKPVTTGTAPTEEPAPVKPKTTRTTRTARAKTPTRTPSRRPSATAAKKREEPATTATGTTSTPPATATAEPALNPRLIIETRDGMRVERYMSQVRRVTVERGLLIVVTSDGKVERRPMTNVLRVTIEP